MARAFLAALLGLFLGNTPTRVAPDRWPVAPERRDPRSLLLALDTAEKAWALDPTPVTAWMRATALAPLAAEDVAENAWNDFLALDPVSDRAEEARHRRAQLRVRRPITVGSGPPPAFTAPTSGYSLIERYDELFAAYLRDNDFDHAAAILTYRAEALDKMRSADEALSDLVKARHLVSGRTLVGRRVLGALAEAARRRGFAYAARALAREGESLRVRPRAVYARAKLTRDPDVLSRHFEATLELALDAEQRLFQRQAAIEIANGSPAAALWMSDRARLAPVHCRTRGDAIDERGRQLARCVPAGVTLIHQDLENDVLNTWILRDGSIAFHFAPVSAPRLLAQIESFVDDSRAADDLYDVLVRPIEREIGRGDLLVFSPSPNLRNVPFSALHDGKAFLLQRRRVMTTESISSFELPRTASLSASALVMLPAHAPGVSELPGAEREVHAIGEMYGPRATVLTDAAATPESFLDRAAQHDVLHLSSHGYASDLPYQNAIDFGSRRIRAYDVSRLRLRRAPIVFLAACRTASDSGGPLNMSLVEAFLHAGASAVVGTLWLVDDSDTAALSIDFHRELTRGATPQDALRAVQLRRIREGRPVSDWAAFQVSS